METPLSTRRITRSLAAATASAQKTAAAADLSCRSKKSAGPGDAPPRTALYDITNDSPIVGLAAGGLGTPQASTAGAKNQAGPRCTPGSGEALLRGQVKTLLQKVDEEGAAAIRPLRIHGLLGVARSPAQLLAPTPANTPQLWPSSAASLLPDGLSVMPCVLEEEELIPKLQVIADPPPNRALVFDDSPEKSDLSTDGSLASSTLTFHGSSGDRSADEDSSSVWSMQVNVSSEKGDEELGLDTVGELEEEYDTEEELEEGYYTEEEEGDWEEEDDDECFDELCVGMSKMSVFDGEEEKKKVGLLAFEGRHTRFVYNSDDEIVERKEVENAAAEHDALLRGLPVPEGKHLLFQDDDDDEE
uniref:Uncharacterized protein n=1 Tax=Avena sativa TaxID=4498 RepID=A0ACD5THK7_AVESA